ncbi:MAG: 50S ribosomal protein L4 [Sulfolobales archaeon]
MTYKLLLLTTGLRPKKLGVYDLNGSIVSEVELPLLFNYPVRKDVIRRAFLASLTSKIQPKGRDLLAGKRRVGESWGINRGVARVPRLDNGRAVIAPMTRGGRLAHPPRVDARIREEVNDKERVLAIVSALSATSEVSMVRSRGHIVNHEQLPVLVVDKFEEINITSDVKKVLTALKLWDDVVRAKEGIKITAGKGKMRGRKYREPKSLLAIVSSNAVPVVRALRNLPGVDVVPADSINIEVLAPGGVPGRLTLITLRALDIISKKYEVITP